MDLADKSVLITGAKRIGAALARELARRGADVTVTYCHSRDEALATVESVRAQGRRAMALHADLRSPDAGRCLVEEIVERIGRLDVLLAMASVYARTPFDTLSERDWCTSLSVDLSASFHTAYGAIRQMQAQGTGGRVLFFADSEAASGRPHHKGYLPYFVAKSGVIALGKALAFEVAADGILVNTLALGPILPSDDATEAENAQTARATPVGRWGGVCEVAKAAIAVLESDYITGEVIRLDGGRHLA